MMTWLQSCTSLDQAISPEELLDVETDEEQVFSGQDIPRRPMSDALILKRKREDIEGQELDPDSETTSFSQFRESAPDFLSSAKYHPFLLFPWEKDILWDDLPESSNCKDSLASAYPYIELVHLFLVTCSH